jgi:hypothetical protein
MMTKCSNGRSLLITHKSLVDTELGGSLVPCIVLLTAWSASRASISFWKSLIKFLLDKGTTYFVCIGSFSEKLHDEIDELMYQYDDEQGTERSINIVTTYHADDTLEEVVDYCVYATELKDKDNGCILAILDESSEEDQNMEAFLKKA